MTSTATLPGASDLVAALQQREEEEDGQCQALVLQCLWYGINVGDADAAKNEEATTLLLSNRRKESCAVLSEAWTTLSSLSSTTTENGGGGGGTRGNEFQHVLVDSLWLVSSALMESIITTQAAQSSQAQQPEAASTPKAAATTQDAAIQSHPSFQSVLELIRSLLRVAASLAVAASPQQQPSSSSSSTSFAVELQSNLCPLLLEQLNSNRTTATAAVTEDLTKRLRMHNTQVNYKQQKYNLLQEESEGYAKLVQILKLQQQQQPLDKVDNDVDGREDARPSSTSSAILQLVGSFKLDPNRVLDLVIDALEKALYPTTTTEDNNGQRAEISLQPQSASRVEPLLSILRTFSETKIASVIKFKLNSNSNGDGKGAAVATTNGETVSVNTDTLVAAVAFLVREDVLDLSILMRYLGRVDDDIEKAYKAFWILEKGKIVSLTRISLGGGEPKEDPKLAANVEKLQQLLVPLESNPGLSVMLLLIQSGKWNSVKPLLVDELWSQLCCLFPDAFGSAFCGVAQSVVDQWYKMQAQDRPLLRRRSSVSENANDDDQVLETTEQELDGVELIRVLWETLSRTIASGCISERPGLFCDICRILRRTFESTESLSTSRGSYDFFSRFMVPSISLFPSNPAVSTELWLLLQNLPYSTRYKMYNDWRGLGLGRGGMSSMVGGKPLPNVLAEVEAGKAARYVLKRLSKDNIRDMSRQLAKVTHANPLVVYATILDQIESYDNMVEVMVEAQRFVNPLGLDVLGYCILGRLSGSTGGVNRSRLKEDGVNVSQWLQSLETFTGEFYKCRPFVELQGILSYLMKRLKGGYVMELGVLRTLLKVSAGFDFADYSPAEALSENQLYGRAGTFALKRETMSFGIMEKTNPKASESIKKLFQKDGRGVTLLILIAQARDRILFDAKRGSSKNIKLAGNLYDSCQINLSILLEFLTTDYDFSNGKQEMVGTSQSLVYSQYLPTLLDLHTIFGLDFETACSLRRSVANGSRSDEELLTVRDELTPDICKAYFDCLPEVLFDFVTPKLLEVFQMNASFDILLPESVYSTESERIAKELQTLRSTNSSSPIQDTEKATRLQSVVATLEQDAQSQAEHVKKTLDFLDEEKSVFFVAEDVSQEASRLFLVHCVFPRSLISPDDALYATSFVFHLHKIWTPGFSTIHFLDEMIALVSGALFGLTEGEAANAAVLIWQSWKIISKWRYEEEVFNKDVLGKPGSQVVEELEDGQKTSKSVSYHDYIQLYQIWHSVLGSALIGCLSSKEYMHIRTGLLILTRLVDVFPTRPVMGAAILGALSPLQDENTSRPDIRASANAYGMMLLKARDEGKWFEENEADAKARADKEVEAALERKKKLEQNFQELERDSNQITAEIGPRDRFDRRRDESDGGRQPGGRGTVQVNGGSTDASRLEPQVRRDRNRDDRDYRPTREAEDRDRNQRGDDRARDRGDNGDWRRGGINQRDDRRWERDAPPARSGKHSRTSSPDSDRETERVASKRQRLDGDAYSSRRNPPVRTDPSPPSRRGRRESPEPPSRSRSRRSRR